MLQHSPIEDADQARRDEVRIPSKESLRASGQVQSLSRALKLLNALSYYAQGLSLSEVASEVGLPNSTAHRLLTTLQNERYVRFDNERSAWMIGVQAFRVGSTFVRSRDLVSISRPYMRRLMDQSGETVNLGMFDRGEIVYLAPGRNPEDDACDSRPWRQGTIALFRDRQGIARPHEQRGTRAHIVWPAMAERDR